MTRMLLVTIVLGLLTVTPGFAQIEFPPSYAGIWEFTTTERNCGSPTVIDTYTETDTLCAGEVFDPGDEANFVCTGTVDDTSIDVNCTGSFDVDGCTVTMTFTTSGTKSGDSYTGTDTFSITYGAGCGPIPDQCTESSVTGTRVAPAPGICSPTPVAQMAWSQLKRIYR